MSAASLFWDLRLGFTDVAIMNRRMPAEREHGEPREDSHPHTRVRPSEVVSPRTRSQPGGQPARSKDAQEASSRR